MSRYETASTAVFMRSSSAQVTHAKLLALERLAIDRLVVMHLLK